MDRNQIAGLVVMLILMTVYFQFFAPETPEQPTETELAEGEVVEEQPTSALSTASSTTQTSYEPQADSLVGAIQKERYGLFANFANGTEETTTIENDVVKISISNKGAVVNNVELKDFLTYDKKPLILLDAQSSQKDLILMSNYKPINISELFYQVEKSKLVVQNEDSLSVSYRLTLEEGKYIEQKYTLGGTGYELLYEINFVGLDGIVDNQDVQLTWAEKMKRVEQAMVDARSKTTINFETVAEGFDDVSISNDPESESVNQPLNWFAFKQKFFTAALISDNAFLKGVLSTTVDENDSTVVKSGVANITIPVGDLKTGKGNFKYYFGPNNYQITKKVTPGFGKNVELGWSLFRFVNQWLIIPIFDFLQRYISSYGIIIIILVFVIRLLLAPLTWKSHMSMAKMKVLKPEMDAIKEKNDGDAQKTQQETMALYNKAGINPLSGCIPVALQFPFLLAMFNFFPNSIELRQQAFLWAKDLSTYDSILDLPFTIPFYGDHVSLFCLLMTGSTLILTQYQSQMNTQMQGPMKSMQYMMPVMFLFFLNNYSAGLTFYYFVSNLVSFGQMAVFRKVIDEDKIKKVMEENRKKNANKKKSKFQLKLDEAMKSSEESRKKKGKKKK